MRLHTTNKLWAVNRTRGTGPGGEEFGGIAGDGRKNGARAHTQPIVGQPIYSGIPITSHFYNLFNGCKSSSIYLYKLTRGINAVLICAPINVALIYKLSAKRNIYVDVADMHMDKYVY